MTKSYARQTILAEVGEAGQARIHAARAVVRTRGLAAEIAERYLVAAGFGEVRVSDEPDAVALPFEARDASARAVAEGAYRALVLFREAIRCGS
jgi:molybdopterin/thiamine biosynthesis adenylyltransferase